MDHLRMKAHNFVRLVATPSQIEFQVGQRLHTGRIRGAETSELTAKDAKLEPPSIFGWLSEHTL